MSPSSSLGSRYPHSGADLQAMLAGLSDGHSGSYAPKDTVFRRGDPADAIFYIHQGNIRISAVSDQGKEGVLATLGPGEFFGEACLTGQTRQEASAIAMDHAIVYRIHKESVVRALRELPAFAEMFNSFLLSRNIQIEAALIDQLSTQSDKRLARTLLFLARFGKDREMVRSNLNQDVLAARLEAMRSRIRFFMNKFRELGPGEAKDVDDASESLEAQESERKPKKPRS